MFVMIRKEPLNTRSSHSNQVSLMPFLFQIQYSTVNRKGYQDYSASLDGNEVYSLAQIPCIHPYSIPVHVAATNSPRPLCRFLHEGGSRPKALLFDGLYLLSLFVTHSLCFDHGQIASLTSFLLILDKQLPKPVVLLVQRNLLLIQLHHLRINSHPCSYPMLFGLPFLRTSRILFLVFHLLQKEHVQVFLTAANLLLLLLQVSGLALNRRLLCYELLESQVPFPSIHQTPLSPHHEHSVLFLHLAFFLRLHHSLHFSASPLQTLIE